MAVIVQQMVAATASGILFTCNPVTCAQNEMVINTSWGLGEAIVSGHVSPDVITIDKESGQVKCTEQHFQAPQDIEWAIANNQVFVLQARPVTTRPRIQAVTVSQKELVVPAMMTGTGKRSRRCNHLIYGHAPISVRIFPTLLHR